MESMPSEARVLTIGHSNHSWERFSQLLRGAGVTAVADVRTSPWSRHTPHFNRDSLAERLMLEGVAYVFLGAELGGRPAAARLFDHGVADYEAMAVEPKFREGLNRVAKGVRSHVVALMCSEQEPLDCHRCLLVSRRLQERGLLIAHIRSDGTVEPHEATVRRLLASEGLEHEDIFESEEARIARAYAQRARKVAYAEAMADTEDPSVAV
ncbi:DUF488 domain-containing protein [Caulobacter endophyticus]|uniref:DUF488 domain-containing protein n=1 Tax=Caulobacter endophyticus TaxID=2172652 RepID=UPI00240ED3C6|nr:DUF488 domain-containing protein [Caulobacter endophyticus]MDG2527180.1 DUF488 domain-containing protein [Caulobacter endophyticus]